MRITVISPSNSRSMRCRLYYFYTLGITFLPQIFLIVFTGPGLAVIMCCCILLQKRMRTLHKEYTGCFRRIDIRYPFHTTGSLLFYHFCFSPSPVLFISYLFAFIRILQTTDLYIWI